MPAAQPSFSMKSGVIGYSPTRPRMPSVPKYFLLIAAPMFLFGVLYRSDHAHYIDSFGHIMNAKDARALGHGQRCQRQAAVQTLADRTIQRQADHALS